MRTIRGYDQAQRERSLREVITQAGMLTDAQLTHPSYAVDAKPLGLGTSVVRRPSNPGKER